LPPSVHKYAGLAFSPEGDIIYFTRFPLADGQQADVYRVSIFGGLPTKIIEQAQGWISVSQSGDKISFVRCAYLDDDYCSLWIADTDGADQQRLVSRPRPFRISDNAISPDSSTVAFASGQSNNASNEFSLMEVDAASGAEREITKERFFNIRKLAWLPGREGLLISASQVPNLRYRIWNVNYLSGAVRSVTSDADNLSAVSIDRAATAIVASKIHGDFQIKLLSNGKSAGDVKGLVDASSMTIAPDGKLFFASGMTGNSEIWSMEPDGTSLRQLTNDKADDHRPQISADGRTVYFSSNRSGEAQVWRINADGSGLVRITEKEGGLPVFASSDGRWIYFQSGRRRSLWRAPANGGAEEAVLDEPSTFYKFSRDGNFIAFPDSGQGGRSINIVSIDRNLPVGKIALPAGSGRIVDLEWHKNGKAISYILADPVNGRYSIWRQAIAGGEPKMTFDLGTDDIRESSSFAFAPDETFFGIIQGRWKHDAVIARGLTAQP
jgi:eukaryotic-like serine/threonine-protein kinase